MIVASTALAIWPIISVCLFKFLGGRRGLIYSVMIGFLFLPPNYFLFLPVVPKYGSGTAIAAGLALSYLFFRNNWHAELGDTTRRSHLLGGLMIVLVVLYFINPFLVFLTNREGLSFGPKIIQGLGLSDVLKMIWNAAATIIPFLLGWRLLAREEDHRLLLRVLVILMFGYSLLALFEVRMSPQLNQWVYGYFPHDWLQHLRGGSFRPVVFLGHGLVLGFHLFWATLACAILVRGTDSIGRMTYLAGVLWFVMVLLFSKNLGSVLLAVLFLPTVFLLGSGMQIRVAAIIAVLFLSYPIVRSANLLPIDSFTSIVRSISPDRTRSFETRLRNEQLLLERAQQKPLAGWGGYARSRIHNEAGSDISLVDGAWIGRLGTRGWSGYVSFFGMFTLPMVWLLILRRRKPVPTVTSGLALMVGAILIELVPNATLSSVGLVAAGALTGFVLKESTTRNEKEAPDGQGADRQVLLRSGPRYTRFDGVGTK